MIVVSRCQCSGQLSRVGRRGSSGYHRDASSKKAAPGDGAVYGGRVEGQITEGTLAGVQQKSKAEWGFLVLLVQASGR